MPRHRRTQWFIAPLAGGLLLGGGAFMLMSHAPPRPHLQPIAGLRNRETAPYRNCAEARAAGAAPVYAGQPGYGPWLDADHDGIGCEPYP